jgi:hypothetical protein
MESANQAQQANELPRLSSPGVAASKIFHPTAVSISWRILTWHCFSLLLETWHERITLHLDLYHHAFSSFKKVLTAAPAGSLP